MTDRIEKDAARERMEILRGLVSRQSINSKGEDTGEGWKQRCAMQLCGLALAEIAETLEEAKDFLAAFGAAEED